MMHWSALSTVCGLPAVTLPAGSIDGLPVGVQLIGPRDGEGRLLAIAQAVEERLGGFRPPPPL
jgi:amidase